MFYNYKNCKIALNGKDVYASSAQISLESDIAPVYLAKQRHTDQYIAENGIGGGLKFNYYLTGSDFLKEFIDNEKTVISGNFGGLLFKSGYLKTYALNCQPNAPVEISAEVVFFDELKGQFSPTYESASEIKVLNFSNAVVTDLANGSAGSLANLIGVTFTFNSDIKPVYIAGDTVPKDVFFGVKEISAEVFTDTLSGDLPVSGKNAGLRITLSHPLDNSITETFTCSGKLNKRNYAITSNEMMRGGFSIRQNSVNVIPSIVGFSPQSGAVGTLVNISGDNLDSAFEVLFNGALTENVEIIDENLIQAYVPYEALSGPIVVSTNGGSAVSATNFTFLPAPITISSLSQPTGKAGQQITILGNNFFRISDIYFGTTPASNFRVVNSGFAIATVPHGAAWDYVKVVSQDYNLTGTSATKFVPFPVIQGFNPPSGSAGQTIQISGESFSGVSGVEFNNISATFTVDSNTGITATVPVGNTNGFITVLGQSGTYAMSAEVFSALVSITGLSSYSGVTGDPIQIYGSNFTAALMYDLNADNKYVVSFGGGTGTFQRISSSILSGIVPSGAVSGPVAVMVNDGNSYYPSQVSFLVKNGPPQFSAIIPHSGKSGDYAVIFGQNLLEVSTVSFVGGSTANATDIQEGELGDALSFRIPALSQVGDYVVTVTTPIGSATGAFTLIAPPIISGFTPTSGVVGQLITLTGNNLYSFSKVFVGGAEAHLYTGGFLANNSRLQFYIPFDSPSSGRVIVDNTAGTATGNYLIGGNGPAITTVTPASGIYGSSIQLSGSNFNSVIGVSIGDTTVTSYSIVNQTGITFTIPEDSVTDYILLYTAGATASSPEPLIVNVPPVVISGFTPTTTIHGSTILISGSRMNSVIGVYFSGDGEEIAATDFNAIGTTGLEVIVPSEVVNGKIKVDNGFITQSSQTLFINDGPEILALIQNSGQYNTDINISGEHLNGMSFFFVGATGDYVQSLQTTYFGETGVKLRVPREIVSGPITISGSGQFFGQSEDFFPIPTISGFYSTSAVNGDTVVITGINAYSIASLIGISGSGAFHDLIDTLDITSLSGDFSRITGAGVDSRTGYAIFTIRVNTDFIGSGKLFLVSDVFSSYNSVEELTGIYNPALSSSFLNTVPSAPVISSFTPTRGGALTTVTIHGTSLSYVTGLQLVNGVVSGLTIDSQTSTSITFHAPSVFSATSGQFRALSPYGVGNSTNYFTVIPLPTITSLSVTRGRSDTNVLISGTNLNTITGLYFGEEEAYYDIMTSSGISGLVPYFESYPKYVKVTAYNEAGSGSYTGWFLTYDSATILTYKTENANLVSLPPSSGVLFQHNLGTTPDIVQFYFVCQSPDLGYSVGDEIIIDQTLRVDVGPCLVTYSKNETVIGLQNDIRDNTNIEVMTKDTNIFGEIDNTKWKIRGVAYASYYKVPNPEPPTNFAVTALDEQSFGITWTPPNSHLDGYKLERRTTGSWTQIATISPTGTSYIDSGLSENTTYYYRLKGYNAEF